VTVLGDVLAPRQLTAFRVSGGDLWLLAQLLRGLVEHSSLEFVIRPGRAQNITEIDMSNLTAHFNSNAVFVGALKRPIGVLLLQQPECESLVCFHRLCGALQGQTRCCQCCECD